ncbi:hypothetical protein EJP80_06595 [Rahnella aquatilis]|nr:hypothetical protein EJP80_06595 [Rahnella aquatilis]
MKNWSVKDTKAVKTWINVDTYTQFEEILLFRLYHELWARTPFFKSYRDEHENKTMMSYFKNFQWRNLALGYRIEIGKQTAGSSWSYEECSNYRWCSAT